MNHYIFTSIWLSVFLLHLQYKNVMTSVATPLSLPMEVAGDDEQEVEVAMEKLEAEAHEVQNGRSPTSNHSETSWSLNNKSTASKTSTAKR